MGRGVTLDSYIPTSGRPDHPVVADAAESELRARLIAFYLPQFHPIPENDDWWGKGFTEWTNVARARPLFPGHRQPLLPSDLGFYDLRVPEVRIAQANMARAHGIEGFCYWHYWFGGGRRILERVFDEVLSTGQPDFPFCLAWANQTWSGIWHGAGDRVLVEQTYPGEEDYREHFDFLLKAFRDPRYIRVDGKPLFVVYRATELPNSRELMALWRKLANEAGLEGLFIAGVSDEPISTTTHGYDARLPNEPARFAQLGLRLEPALPFRFRVRRKLMKILNSKSPKDLPFPTILSYQHNTDLFVKLPPCDETTIPCVIPNWDNTPRSAHRGYVFPDATPEAFRPVLRKAIHDVSARSPEHRLVFIKSWNEWAEGNHLEPDQEYGDGFLRVVREEVQGIG